MHTSKLESAVAATIDTMRVPKTAPITRKCDCCGEAQAVLDAPTVHGPWAYMCLACVSTHGVAGYARIGTRLLGIPTAQIPWTPPLPTDGIDDSPLPLLNPDLTDGMPTRKVFHSSETDADLALGWYHTAADAGAAEATGPFNCVTDAIADYSK